MPVNHVNKTVIKLVEVKEEILEKVVIECTPLQATLLKVILSQTTGNYFREMYHELFPKNEVNLPIFKDVFPNGTINLHLLKESDIDFIRKCLIDKK
jgi:hypothetical protein